MFNNVQQKFEIINLIESGESVMSIADKYGVGKSKISDIGKKKKRSHCLF